MLKSARGIRNGETLEADVCIVGAGPAGITLAMALAGSGRRILLIEAGGARGPGGAQALYRGETADPAFHQPPDSDRTRGLGGSSSMWGGRCMPYDRQDFEPRAHIANSGWPFDLAELEPYYRRAQKIADCGDYAYRAGAAGLPGEMIEGAQTGALRLDSLERWSPPVHFGKANRAALAASQEITVLTGAVVTGLEHANGRVSRVLLKSIKGADLGSVSAGIVVLAGGGLETPRLLMHTATATSPALGDHSGWLGRGYMSHVGGVIARLQIAPQRKVIFGYEQDGAGVFVRRRLTLSPEAQAEERLPNMYALLDRPLLDDASHNSAVLSAAYLVKRLVQRQTTDTAGTSDTGRFAHYRRHIKNLLFGAPEVLTVLPKFGRKRFLTGRRVPSLLLASDDNRFYLYFHAEQSAHPDSRIVLSDERDSLGMRRLRVEGKLLEDDAHGIVRAHRRIGAELERSGAGRLEFLGDDPLALVRTCKSTLGHHIGAARMSTRPKDGVVDANGRVHETENLYVLGAAALPTSSQAHPTLTILALAFRMADHICG